MKLSSLTASTTLAFIALIGSSAQQAQAQDQGFFIDGRVGQSDLRDVPPARKDTGFTFGGGYWFNKHFAVEGGWAKLHDRRYGGGTLELDGFYAGVKGRALFDRGNGTGFFLGGRGGLFHWDAGMGPSNRDGTDLYAGVFAGYQITPHIGLSVNVDRFNAEFMDTDMIGAGFEYKF